jgi:single-strand DNA-binding protein
MANRGLNNVVLMGHLGGDAKRINSQRGFGCNFNLATTRRYKKTDGNWTEETTWVRCSFWNSENVYNFLKQGRQVVIEGHLVNFPYQDSGGKELKLMEVAVDALILTDYRSRQGSSSDEQEGEEPAQAGSSAPGGPQVEAELVRVREYEAHLKGQAELLYSDLEAKQAELDKRIAALSAGLPVEAAPGTKPRQSHKASAPAQKRARTAPRGRR